MSYLRSLWSFNCAAWLYLAAVASVGAGVFGVLNVTRNKYLLRLAYGPDFVGRTAAIGHVAWAPIALPGEFLAERYRAPWITAPGELSRIGIMVCMVRGYPVLAGATAALEAVIAAHPKVREAAAIGVPSELEGETVWVYVVPAAGEMLTTGELLTYSREEMAAYKVPQQIRIVGSLPRTPRREVCRSELREQAQQEIAARLSAVPV
jgi:hypothetical protein